MALLPRATNDVGANNRCDHPGSLTAHVRFHTAIGSTAPPPSVLAAVTPSYVHLNRVRKNDGFRQTEKGTSTRDYPKERITWNGSHDVDLQPKAGESNTQTPHGERRVNHGGR